MELPDRSRNEVNQSLIPGGVSAMKHAEGLEQISAQAEAYLK